MESKKGLSGHNLFMGSKFKSLENVSLEVSYVEEWFKINGLMSWQLMVIVEIVNGCKKSMFNVFEGVDR